MEQLIPDRNCRYTEEQYLQISAASELKYEFRGGQLIPFGGWARDSDGQIIGMAGGAAAHNDIAMNLIKALGRRLADACRLGGSDLRVRTPRLGRYCYPDVSVTCQARVFDPPGSQLTLVNPQVIIEVMSKSTAADDRGEKLTDYIGIESLQEYILFEQDRPRAETFYRQLDGVWAIGPWTAGIEGSISFRSLGITVPLTEVYAGVEFVKTEHSSV